MNSAIPKLSKAIIAFSLVLFSQISISDNMHDALFSTIDDKMIEANKLNAKVLSPTNYNKAAGLYKSASERLQKGQNIDKIRKDITKSTGHIDKAIEFSKIAKVSFTKQIKARQDAIKANAEKFAGKEWLKAEDKFRNAAKRIETGNMKRALKEAAEAETLFRTAELAAIKENYLKGARDLIIKAKKEKVDRAAPITLAKAEDLLSNAERELNENRYDFDRPRALAREAQYEANHAFQIANSVKPLPKKKTNEQLVLELEDPIVRIASALDLTPTFDGSSKDPVSNILGSITALQKDSYELEQKKDEIATLEKNMSELETRLGLQSERIAIQEENKQKFQRVENLFADNEAVVLKQGSNIVLRLIGLSFKSGKSDINSEYFGLLKKVERAISLYPQSTILVEGHTDSFGGDDANLELSQIRAESVRSYLMANVSGLLSSAIRSEGFGESRPIGNNETPEGRTRNRRIDLVIMQK